MAGDGVHLTSGERQTLEAIRWLKEELGRWPTRPEVSKRTGLPPSSITIFNLNMRNKGIEVWTSTLRGNSSLLLSPRQEEIFRWIRGYILEHGYGPTVREIGKEFGIHSPNGVMCHLAAMQKKGYIHRVENLSRSITLVGHGTCPHCRGTGLAPAEEG